MTLKILLDSLRDTRQWRRIDQMWLFNLTYGSVNAETIKTIDDDKTYMQVITTEIVSELLRRLRRVESAIE